MKKKYKHITVSLLSWLLVFYTFLSCSHVSQALRLDVTNQQNNKCFMEKSNALAVAFKLLAFPSVPCKPVIPPCSNCGKFEWWPKIKDAKFNNPTFDAIRASADTTIRKPGTFHSIESKTGYKARLL